MDQYNQQENIIGKKEFSAAAARAFVAQVFSWMFGALIVTAVIAYAFANSDLITWLFDQTTGKATPFFWIAAFSPLAIILVMNFGYERISTPVMILLFVTYAALMGVSMSTVFLAFEPMVIAKAFGLSAGVFGVMAIAGYTTKADLSRFGMIMLFGLFGIFAAILVNYFMHSSTISFLIDIACLVVFTGLTAWKMQVIRQMGEMYGTSKPKMVVYMALSLYVTFINLFMTILRLMGGRR